MLRPGIFHCKLLKPELYMLKCVRVPRWISAGPLEFPASSPNGYRPRRSYQTTYHTYIRACTHTFLYNVPIHIHNIGIYDWHVYMYIARMREEIKCGTTVFISTRPVCLMLTNIVISLTLIHICLVRSMHKSFTNSKIFFYFNGNVETIEQI